MLQGSRAVGVPLGGPVGVGCGRGGAEVDGLPPQAVAHGDPSGRGRRLERQVLGQPRGGGGPWGHGRTAWAGGRAGTVLGAPRQPALALQSGGYSAATPITAPRPQGQAQGPVPIAPPLRRAHRHCHWAQGWRGIGLAPHLLTWLRRPRGLAYQAIQMSTSPFASQSAPGEAGGAGPAGAGRRGPRGAVGGRRRLGGGWGKTACGEARLAPSPRQRRHGPDRPLRVPG